MTKPVVSKDFNLEDIRKIREYNSLRHVQMTPREIIEDTRKGATIVLERLQQSEKVNGEISYDDSSRAKQLYKALSRRG